MNEEWHRTNLHLYRTDVEYLRNLLDYGWTERVREVVHDYVKAVKNSGSIYPSYERWTERPPIDE